MLSKSQKSIVRVNSSGSDLIKRRLNFIEGSGIGLSISADDSTNEINIEISATEGGVSGSGNEIQYNDSGAFGSDTNFVFDPLNTRVGVGIDTPEMSLHLNSATDTDEVGFRVDSAATQGYFYAIGIDDFVYIGSKTSSDLKFVRGGEIYMEFTTGEISYFAPQITINGDLSVVDAGAFFDQTGSVFNEESAAIDFRVESVDNQYMIYVIGATNQVGIGTSTPGVGYTMEVAGDLQILGDIKSNGLLWASDGVAGVLTAARYENWNTGSTGVQFAVKMAYDNSGYADLEINGLSWTKTGVWGATASDRDATFSLKNFKDGTNYEILKSNATETVINDSGDDMDFRVEGDTDANNIFSNAGTNRVGFGVSTPVSKVSVNGDIALVDGMTAPSNDTGYAKIYIDSADGDFKIKFADGVTKVIAADS